MGGKSSIDRLDPELRSTLIDLLNDPNVTQQTIADTINEAAGEKAHALLHTRYTARQPRGRRREGGE